MADEQAGAKPEEFKPVPLTAGEAEFFDVTKAPPRNCKTVLHVKCYIDLATNNLTWETNHDIPDLLMVSAFVSAIMIDIVNSQDRRDKARTEPRGEEPKELLISMILALESGNMAWGATYDFPPALFAKAGFGMLNAAAHMTIKQLTDARKLMQEQSEIKNNASKLLIVGGGDKQILKPLDLSAVRSMPGRRPH